MLVGCLLLSASAAKFLHLSRFRQGIRDYQVISPALEKRLHVSNFLSFFIPALELLSGLGLVSGFWLMPAALVAAALLLGFSAALTFNLVRGRYDLSCYCGGVLGDHRISWWMVGRNGLLLIALALLLLTPQDRLTLEMLVRNPGFLSQALVPTILPVVLFVGVVLLMLLLVNAARVLWRQNQ